MTDRTGGGTSLNKILSGGAAGGAVRQTNDPGPERTPLKPGAYDVSLERELGKLARSTEPERGASPEAFAKTERKHPALVACEKAAEMVRGLHQRHEAEGETLAQHLEQIGQDVLDMCKEAAAQVRAQRIMPKEMADKIADDLINIGQTESARQAVVAKGLTAARDAIIGIDQAPKQE